MFCVAKNHNEIHHKINARLQSDTHVIDDGGWNLSTDARNNMNYTAAFVYFCLFMLTLEFTVTGLAEDNKKSKVSNSTNAEK